MRRMSAAVLFLGLVAPAFAQQPAAHTYPELPEGAGKETLVKVCAQCHSPDNVIANGRDRAGWEAEITKMAGFGAQGSDEEFTAILDYLTKNFPGTVVPVKVNLATVAELQSGLGLDAAEADAVVAYRKKNGDFKTVEELEKVPDVDVKKIEAKKDQVRF